MNTARTDGIEILAGGPLDHIAVAWDPAPLVLSPTAQAYVDARWDDYMRAAQRHGQTLFDGGVTRLLDHRVAGRTLHLRLGPANFKTALVTGLRDRAWFLAHAPEAIYAALGSSGLLSYGDQCVLGIRSAKVAAYPGRAHLFGGGVERLDTAELPASIDGLLAHLYSEFQEELGLTKADLATTPRLLAMARDQVLWQPELLWHCQLARPIETIIERLQADEHTDYLLLPRDPGGAPPDARLTPCARLAVKLWRNG